MANTIHNPAQFDPSNYEVVDYADNRRPSYMGQTAKEYEQEVEWWKHDMLRLFGSDWATKIHRCVHCGATNIRWITAVRHIPTGEVVVFGAICTDRLGFANRMAFKLAQLQAKADAQKVRFVIYEKRQAFLADHPELAKAIETIDDPIHAKNFFAKDVVAKLNRWGSLSDAQVNAVIASLKRDHEFAARKAAEAQEVVGDAPTGRQTVTGTVLSVKDVESMYGITEKMLIKLENNAKVWVTVPGAVSVQRGNTVTVTATWTVSDKDNGFAYGKRPVVSAVVVSANG